MEDTGRIRQDLIPDGQMDGSMTGWGTEEAPRVCREDEAQSLRLSRGRKHGMSLGRSRHSICTGSGMTIRQGDTKQLMKYRHLELGVIHI